MPRLRPTVLAGALEADFHGFAEWPVMRFTADQQRDWRHCARGHRTRHPRSVKVTFFVAE